jgi:hypothetical protein
MRIHPVGNNDEDSWCGEISEMEVSVADCDASIESDFLTIGHGDMDGIADSEEFVERPPVSFVERPMEHIHMNATTLWTSPPTVMSSANRFPSVQTPSLVPSGHGAEPTLAHVQQRWMDSMERSQQSLDVLQGLSSGFCPFHGHAPRIERVPCSVSSHEDDPLPLVVSSLPYAMDAAPMLDVTSLTVCSSDMHSNAASSDTLPYYSTEVWQEMEVILMHRLDQSMKRSQATNPFWATASLLAQVDSSAT